MTGRREEGHVEHDAGSARPAADGRGDSPDSGKRAARPAAVSVRALDSELLKGLSLGREEAISELARWYFRWIGPASVAEFQWFSGVGAKAAKAAVEQLGLMPATSVEAELLAGQQPRRH